MKTIPQFVSLVSLALVAVPSVVYFAGGIELPLVKTLALVGTLGWFASTPLWIGRAAEVDDDQVQI
jgi:hypothetical protein